MIFIKKFLKIFVCYLMIFPLMFINVYSEGNGTGKKKAVIIVPGVLMSGLYYNDKENFKYYENELVWMGVGSSKIRTVKAISKFLFYYKDLFCDENGTPINKHIGISKGTNYAYESDAKIAKFGVLSLCEKLTDELNKNFSIQNGGEYEIILHNYDWRIDCAENSKLLTEEIMKYDEVMLIGYSLGGLISCKSAAELKEKNELQRIKTFISVAVPYNGAAEALCVLEKGMFTGSNIIDKAIKLIGIPDIMRELSCNCVSTYQLLPTKKFFEKCENGFVCDEQNRLLSYDETLELLKNRSWNKKSDGSDKDFFEKSENFHKSFYVDGNHIVNLMNSYFIAGSGRKTKSKILIDKKVKNSAEAVEYVDGDSTIALNESAVPDGKTIKDIIKVYSKHNEIFNDESTIKYIVDIISKNICPEVNKLAV